MIGFFGKPKILKGSIRKLKKVITRIASDFNVQIISLQFNLIGDKDLLQINQSFLSHDFYTDIITFDYGKDNKIEGDIYISLDRVMENSLKYKTGFHVELQRVIIHGVLHLVGINDKTKKDKEIMRSIENKYIELIK